LNFQNFGSVSVSIVEMANERWIGKICEEFRNIASGKESARNGYFIRLNNAESDV